MTTEEKDSTPQIFLNNEKFEIPEEGMLGLLALGDVGLKIWRQKREEADTVKRKVEGEKKVTDDKGEVGS